MRKPLSAYIEKVEKMIRYKNEELSKHGFFLSWSSATSELKNQPTEGNNYFIVWVGQVGKDKLNILTSGPAEKLYLDYTPNDLITILKQS